MKKLISINLNQTINKAVLAEMKKEQSRWIMSGSIFLLFVMSFGFLVSLNGSLSTLVDKRGSNR